VTKKRPFRWLLAIFGGIFVGAAAFLGAVATNLLTDDMEQLLAPYQVWIWVVFWVALGVAILVAIVSFWPQPAAEPAADPGDPTTSLTNKGAATTTVAAIDGAGDVVVGQGNTQTITTIINNYREADERLDEAALAVHIRGYLAWVQENFGKVTLRGVRRGGSQLIELPLDEVYVPLTAHVAARSEGELLRQAAQVGARRRSDADAPTAAEPQAIPLNRLLTQGKRLVITGGPGCGKTTVLQHIAWALAAALLAGDPALARDRVGLAVADDEGLPLPIFVPLSAYARHRQQHRQDGDPHNRTLATFIADYLIERNCAPGLPRDFFARLLRGGRSVLLLLDGLDEVPDEAERAQVRQSIEQLMAGKPRLRAVVTCRVAAYQGRTALGAEFREVRVDPLAAEHIAALVGRAYDRYFAHDPAQALEKRRELLEGIADLEAQRRQRLGKDAPPLVDSPLMVRLLLIVHLNERRLPQHRAELYQKAVDNLLYPEYTLDEEAAEHLRGLVGGSHETHRDMVQHVAFAMHGQGEQQGREIDEPRLRQVLRTEPAYAPHVEALIRNTRLRGAVLEERLGSYRFVHLAFQEFLAARHLAEVVRGDSEIARFLLEHATGDSWWREPALLTAGYLSLTSRAVADRLVRLLAEQGLEVGNPADLRLAAAELAGVASLEWMAEDAALRAAVTHTLTALLQERSLLAAATPVAKYQAGIALGRLGDERPGVGLRHGLPDIAWQPVDAGPFLMGSDKRKDRRAYDTELPQFTCTLIPQPYRISRYPITGAQYQAFIDAKGYEREELWTKAGWQWRRENDVTGPRQYSEIFLTPNHPQVGVSWYEATAFCTWLSRELGQPVRLPSEAELERAARHTDGRIYPWGDEFDQTACNNRYLNLGSTAAVGIFPTGDSVCGAADMSGNVWEWTATRWADNYQNYKPDDNPDGDASRTLRGGSFDYYDLGVRCACRLRLSPDNMNYNVGFRVVSPGF
jgi:formylglycine-generating enzyme required for sulfatase activity